MPSENTPLIIPASSPSSVTLDLFLEALERGTLDQLLEQLVPRVDDRPIVVAVCTPRVHA